MPNTITLYSVKLRLVIRRNLQKYVFIAVLILNEKFRQTTHTCENAKVILQCLNPLDNAVLSVKRLGRH